MMQHQKKYWRNNINTLFVLLMFCSFPCKAQTLDSNLRKLISKNIMAYHIRNAQPFELGLSDNNSLTNRLMFFDAILPDNEHELSIEFEKCDLIYPNKNYKVFHIIKRGYQFSDSKGNTALDFSFPRFNCDENFLVAINGENNIKFISGNLFRSKFYEDFNLNRNNPSTFIKYLEFYFYYAGVKNIRYKYAKHKIFYYQAFSDCLNKEIILSIDINDWQNIKILYK